MLEKEQIHFQISIQIYNEHDIEIIIQIIQKYILCSDYKFIF